MTQKPVAVITGGTSGLGYHLACNLADKGYFIVVTGRSCEKLPGNKESALFVKCDFADLRSVATSLSDIASRIPPPSIILCNAGVLSPTEYTLTSDGYEYTLQVNVIANILAASVILRHIPEGSKVLVAGTTSPVIKYFKPDYTFPTKDGYTSIKAYSTSKYILLSMLEELKNRHKALNITAAGIDPGTFSSGIYRMQGKFFGTVYKIASPLMRTAGNVAGRFTGTLTGNYIINSYIYPFRGKPYLLPEPPDKGQNKLFVDNCFKIAEEYLSL